MRDETDLAVGAHDRDTAAGGGERARTEWRLDVISDVICPWCYIGKRRLEKALALLAPDLCFRIGWRPFELNPDMPKEGMARADYRRRKFGSLERSKALDAQVAAAGAEEGLSFRFDRVTRTPNTFDAHRVIWLAGREGREPGEGYEPGKGVQNEVVTDLFEAYFVEGRDIGDAAVLADIAARCGLDADRVRGFLAGPEGVAEVRRDEELARRAGIDGVPSFALEGWVLFSGAVPAEATAEALRRATAHLQAEAAKP